jgi:ubiquinone/menaquinone biosynthesis C-methylase UbiE
MAEMHAHSSLGAPDSGRRTWFDPEELLDAFNIKAGSVCADLGCGSGDFTLLLAKRVGKDGKVYAVDTSVAALDQLKIKKPGVNIMTLRAELSETRLPGAACDLVLLAFSLSCTANPGGVLAEAARLLKPDGRLAVIEWRPGPPPPGPPLERRIRSDRMQRLLESHGFVGAQRLREGAVYYTLTASKGKPPAAPARPQPGRPPARSPGR